MFAEKTFKINNVKIFVLDKFNNFFIDSFGILFTHLIAKS
jgi:hypothetical protein